MVKWKLQPNECNEAAEAPNQGPHGMAKRNL